MFCSSADLTRARTCLLTVDASEVEAVRLISILHDRMATTRRGRILVAVCQQQVQVGHACETRARDSCKRLAHAATRTCAQRCTGPQFAPELVCFAHNAYSGGCEGCVAGSLSVAEVALQLLHADAATPLLSTGVAVTSVAVARSDEASTISMSTPAAARMAASR